MFTIVLIEPQIPQNTGNIARLCAATCSRLHIVGDIGFKLDDKHLKRAGLDYWPHVNWQYFPDTKQYLSQLPKPKTHLFTTKSTTSYTSRLFSAGDYLLFGSETTGVPEQYRSDFADNCCTLPMKHPEVRSLNLSTSAGIALYEALRQAGE